MANLLSQNIGTNYKSILNLDATTINTPLDATLRAVTDGMGTSSPLQLSTLQAAVAATITRASGTNTDNPLSLAYTINNSGGTNTVTGFKLNATETAIVGTTHNLMDLQVGGVSKFKVDRAGNLAAAGTVYGQGYYGLQSDTRVLIGGSLIRNNSTGVLTLMNSGETDFGRLQFGGTTSSFPAIKRNGATIDFRLADDSGYCNIGASNITALAGIAAYSTIEGYSSGQAGSFTGAVRVGSAGSNTATAILDVISTTKGFLPPRMTTTQKNAIATPATGLVVFDTTLAKLAVYTGAGWEAVTSI